MLTDIEIAQQCNMLPITDIAAKLGIAPDELEMYGQYKAKLSYGLLDKISQRKPGKLVLVTAITPTPPAKANPRPPSAWPRASPKSVRRPSSPCANLPWDPASASKAALQAAATPRSSPWKTSTCTLPAISTPSRRPICCSRP